MPTSGARGGGPPSRPNPKGSSSSSGAGSVRISARSAGGTSSPAGPSSVCSGSLAEPALPFNPPEHVAKWLRAEDYEALSKAWMQAEAQACALEESDQELADNFSSSTSPSSRLRRSKSQRKRKPWKEDWSLLGNDHRVPQPLRRYFDALPAELSPAKVAQRKGTEQLSRHLSEAAQTSPIVNRSEWKNDWSSVASRDNDGVHQHLRHYFDRRGLQSSFRMRPHVDSEWLQRQRPRSSGRPSPEEVIARGSRSAPSLAITGDEDHLDVRLRAHGSINWGARCLRHGPGATKERVPWVNDHHVSEAEDNEGLNPVLRHYFDVEGLESSYRNRGRHYGRPLPEVCAKGGSPKSSLQSNSRVGRA